MRKLLIALFAGAALFCSPALADWTGKDASSATITFKNPVACASVVCVPVVQLYDGTNVVTLTTAGADGASNTLTGVPTYARMQKYNGTTWDRWTGAVTVASGGIASGAIASGAFASGSIGSGAVASGAVASGAFASGSIGSGAVASGAVASGAYASGSIASGAMVDLGSQADAACGTDNGTCSAIALIKRGNQTATTTATAVQAAIPAGSAIIGKVGIDQTTPGTTNGTVQLAAAVGGSSTTGNIAANNTTAVVVKASAGTLYGAQLYGIGSAPAYLKIYNATSATCGSGTPVKRLMIPAASTAALGDGSNVSFGPTGIAFGTGITYCVTTGITDADTTAPAASTFLVNLDWQ